MALQALPSPDSNSPSPELTSDTTSTNASPISATTSLYPAAHSDDGDSPGLPSSRSTPTRAMSDLTRSPSTGKGGCWTCRVRRKKCDEEREGDSCKTCLRLRIKCLGWGPKRPDWMRDKEKVAAYKANIKEQLSRMGLIRGQPRQPWHGTATHIPSSQPGTPGVGGPGPQTALRRTMSAREPYRRSSSGYGVAASPYHRHHQLAVAGSISDADWLHNVPSTSSRHAVLAGHASTSTPSLNDSMYGFPSPPLSMSGNEDIPYSGYISQQMGMPVAPAAPPHPTPPPLQQPSPASVRKDEYISYYFKYVRELQYVFAGDSLTNILLPIVQASPDGAVAQALCALAALHHARSRIARGEPAEDPDLETSLPRQFFDRALYILRHAPQTNGTGQYADADALAALQLVAYSLLSGGSIDWVGPLDIAQEWLAQTGIYTEENPKLTLLNMTPAGRFAAKATMYTDIFSSITLAQPPRFLSLYRRLFGGGAGYWASNMSPNIGAQQAELRMDSLTGCPDEALLAIAEVSALAHWKTAELQSGSLSVRELVRRGDIIEKELRERTTVKEEELPTGLEMGVTPAGLPMAVGSSSSMSRGVTDPSKQIVGQMFREAAVIYLHTVISDSAPGVPEIMNSVDQMAKLLNELAPSPYDRSLVFPLLLTGSLTDNQMMREVIKHRLFMQDVTMGNILLAQTVMEAIWTHRASVVRTQRPGEQTIIGDWRRHLRLQWASLLVA